MERNDGECGYCGKWGHKRADCRRKTFDEKGRGRGANAAVAGADRPTVSAVAFEEWGMEQCHNGWGVRGAG